MRGAGRRAAAVASTTASELGVGCLGASGVLALLYLALIAAPAQGQNPAEIVRRGFEQKLDSFAWVAGTFTALVSSWSVGQDRRTARLPRYLASPLGNLEYAAGKVAGCLAGCTVVLLPLQAALLVAAPDGLARNAALYAPRASFFAARAEPPAAGGWLLRAGGSLRLHFEAPGAAELECSLDALETVSEPERLPRIRLEDGAGAGLVELTVPRLPLRDFRIPLPPGTTPTLTVTLSAAEGQPGAVRVDAHAVKLVGAPGSWLRSAARSLLGTVAVILLVSLLAVAFSTLLPDVLSLLLSVLLLSVALQRTLLQQVMDSVAAARTGWVHSLAAGMGHWLRTWPDLLSMGGSRVLTRGLEPFGGEDPWRTLPWIVWSAVALAAAAAGTAWRRRRLR